MSDYSGVNRSESTWASATSLTILRFGDMIVGEARNGTWGILGDIVYVKTAVEQSVGRTVADVPLALAGNIQISLSLAAGSAPVAGLSGSDGGTWVDPSTIRNSKQERIM